MKQIVYKKEGFKGELIVGIPSRDERTKIYKEYLRALASGEQEALAALDLNDKAIELGKSKYIKNVKLEHEESGTKYKSFDEMLNDSLCDEIIDEVLSILIKGRPLGEE